MTVPEAAAWIGVPYETPMSMPACRRPHRIPNVIVTGPLTGQMRPADEGVELTLECCWAARIADCSCAEAACSCLISSAGARSWAERSERSADCFCFDW